MAQNQHYQVKQPEIVFENFGDEIVIINLDSGNYYSIDNVAANIWEFLDQGYSELDIANGITDLYQGDREVILETVEKFIDELHQEGLIRPFDEINDKETGKEKGEHKLDGQIKVEFIAPVLNRFTDMQDLLLLDPIHEVDDTGWPNPPLKSAD